MHYTYREDGLCYECRVVEALDRIAYALEGIERK